MMNSNNISANTAVVAIERAIYGHGSVWFDCTEHGTVVRAQDGSFYGMLTDYVDENDDVVVLATWVNSHSQEYFSGHLEDEALISRALHALDYLERLELV